MFKWVKKIDKKELKKKIMIVAGVVATVAVVAVAVKTVMNNETIASTASSTGNNVSKLIFLEDGNMYSVIDIDIFSDAISIDMLSNVVAYANDFGDIVGYGMLDI